MKNLYLLLIATLIVSVQRSNGNEFEWIDSKSGQPASLVSTIIKEGRFVAYMSFNNPVVLDSKLRLYSPKTYDEALRCFGPAFINSDSGGGIWEWHFSDGRTLSCAYPEVLAAKMSNPVLSEVRKKTLLKNWQDKSRR